MPSKKQNNNEALDNLKNNLEKIISQIPKSDSGFAIDFFKNIYAKLFIVRNNNKQKLLDIHSVISYIDGRMRNSKNPVHQAFWAKIYKMLLETREKLEKI